MGISDWLGVGKSIAEPIKAASDLYTTDKARIEAETKFEEIAQKPQLAQLNTNSIMAAAQNIFASGWQPAMGWSCGLLILLYYAPQIVIATYVWGHYCIAQGIVTPFPIKPDDLLNLVYLLFGFGAHSLFKKAP